MSTQAEQLRETIQQRKAAIIDAQIVKDGARKALYACDESGCSEYSNLLQAFNSARTNLSDLKVKLEYDLSALRRMELFR